jgi:hypothetical protein
VDVTPAALTIAANNASKTFGAPDPALTFTITQGSLFAGDSPSGALTRQSGFLPGRYAILQGSLNNPNYDIRFLGAVLTILPTDVVFEPPPLWPSWTFDLQPPPAPVQRRGTSWGAAAQRWFWSPLVSPAPRWR